MRDFYVYILASKRNGNLYVGVTNNLIKRVWEHKKGLVDGFTKAHGVKSLVYYESTGNVQAAIEREKKLKRWKRKWKLDLIEKSNPKWDDLYESVNL